MEEDYQGKAEFNMAAASMERMDALIRSLTNYKALLFVQGQPMHLMIFRLQKALYTELYPYLGKDEVEEANNNFLNIFADNPIISTGTSLIVPRITEQLLDKFELWCMLKMKEHGILQRFGEDPGEAIL